MTLFFRVKAAVYCSIIFITHVDGLYDRYAVRSAVSPHGCEFEVWVYAAVVGR